MNAIHQRLTHITMIAAVLAAAVNAQPSQAVDRAPRIVQLPPVRVVAKRVPVVRLEPVVVIGKRVAPAPLLVAQRPAARSAAGG